jgi:ketosteroid isomerase-like protein
MKPVRMAICAFLLLVPAWAQSELPATEAPQSQDAKILKQLEQDWLDAYREADADKMSAILGDDFVGRWADGSAGTKAEQLKAIRTGEEKHTTNQLLECNVRIYGQTAVVTGINTEQSILEGRDGSGTISFTDVFVKRDGRWQVVASETKKLIPGSALQPQASISSALVGVWKLLSIEDQRSDGNPGFDHDLGPKLTGYLIVDRNGLACIQGMKSDRAKWAQSADKSEPSDAEFLAHGRGFFGYCVTGVKQRGSSLVGHVITSSDPNEVDTEWERPFVLAPDRLLLKPVFVEGGVQIQRTATFDRVR